MLLQEVGGQFMAGDVSFHEGQAGIPVRADEISPVPCAAEVVEDDKVFEPFHAEEVADQSGPDKSGTPGEEDGAKLAHAGD